MTHDPPLFREPAAAPPLPAATRADLDRTLAAPTARDLTFLGRDAVPVRVLGTVLAHGTSRRDEHNDHPGEFVAGGERCSACRWFEVTIVSVLADVHPDTPAEREPCRCPDRIDGEQQFHCGLEPPSGRYLVVTAGRTVVPGETDFRRAEFSDSPFEVIELLRVESGRARARREARNLPESEATRTLPPVSARALAQAAGFDDDLRDAYLVYVAQAASYPVAERRP